MGAIRLELYKLRHKRVLMTIILFLLVEIAWAFAAAGMSFSRNPSSAGWEAVIAMLSSMNGLFMPILTAICVSRICDMEHKGNTWKLLLTFSVRRSTLYAAKYITASMIMLAVCVLQVLAITAFGLVNSFDQSVPILLLFKFIAASILTTMAVTALQQWISMAVKNQAFALTLGMVGGFIGLAADLLPQGVRKIFVWSCYTGLSPVTQSYESDKIQFIVRDLGSMLLGMAVLFAAGIFTYLAGSVHVSRKEV